MNNHAGMEERGNSGHNKSRHFNKNKKRFDKNHMSDNARSNDRENFFKILTSLSHNI